MDIFLGFSITHIYRELNMEADGLSKLALLLTLGHLEIEGKNENLLYLILFVKDVFCKRNIVKDVILSSRLIVVYVK